MIIQKVTITPRIDLANQVISLEEITEEPDLFNVGELTQRHALAVIDLKEKAIREALISLGWAPPQSRPTLSEECPAGDTRFRVRTHDPDTSVRAANRANKFASSHCDRILAALADRDLTAKEIGARAGLTVVQVARRTTDLQRAGRIAVAQTSDGVGGLCDLERDGFRVWRRL